MEALTLKSQIRIVSLLSISRPFLRPFSSNLLEEIVLGVSEQNNYKYQPLLEDTDYFCVLETLYDDFLKNGNLEKFYSKYIRLQCL